MQIMLLLGLEHDVTKLDGTILEGLTRIGLQDDMTHSLGRRVRSTDPGMNLSAHWRRLVIGSEATNPENVHDGPTKTTRNRLACHSAMWPAGARGQQGCKKKKKRNSGDLDRRTAVGDGDVVASRADDQAPIAKLAHNQRGKRRDLESFKAELDAARWAWLGPTPLVRAYDGSEYADEQMMRD